jgi:hypothetical protein
MHCLVVREDIHELFDRGWFALLPDEDGIKEYMDEGKPDFDAAVCQLILFARPHMC